MAVERQVVLRLAAADGRSRAAADLSAVHRDGAALWPATDEGLPELCRLTATAGMTLLPDGDVLLVLHDGAAPARALPDGGLADAVRLRAPAPRAPAGSEAGLASTHPPLRQTEVPS